MTRLPIIERAELDQLIALLEQHPHATSATYDPERRAWTLMTGGYGKRSLRKTINLGPSFDVTAQACEHCGSALGYDGTDIHEPMCDACFVLWFGCKEAVCECAIGQRCQFEERAA